MAKIIKYQFRRSFIKTIYGYQETYAVDEEQAKEKFNSNDCDEFDNKSEYDFRIILKLPGIKQLDIDKMGENMRKEKRDEIPVKPQGYRGAGEHKFKED